MPLKKPKFFRFTVSDWFKNKISVETAATEAFTLSRFVIDGQKYRIFIAKYGILLPSLPWMFIYTNISLYF